MNPVLVLGTVLVVLLTLFVLGTRHAARRRALNRHARNGSYDARQGIDPLLIIAANDAAGQPGDHQRHRGNEHHHHGGGSVDSGSHHQHHHNHGVDFGGGHHHGGGFSGGDSGGGHHHG